MEIILGSKLMTALMELSYEEAEITVSRDDKERAE